jgi:hypothetical protein
MAPCVLYGDRAAQYPRAVLLAGFYVASFIIAKSPCGSLPESPAESACHVIVHFETGRLAYIDGFYTIEHARREITGAYPRKREEEEAMAAEQSYGDTLKQDLGELIAAVDLPELNKHFLRSRWLDQMVWAEGRANSARSRHYALRLIAIVGGVIVPALVSLNLQTSVAAAASWVTFTISLAVAICLALESFFRWGERWTHYRRLSELLKSEGWLFFQLAGPYKASGTHAGAYPEFATRVEAIVASDVETFITQVAREKTKPAQGETPESAGGSSKS